MKFTPKEPEKPEKPVRTETFDSILSSDALPDHRWKTEKPVLEKGGIISEELAREIALDRMATLFKRTDDQALKIPLDELEWMLGQVRSKYKRFLRKRAGKPACTVLIERVEAWLNATRKAT